MITFGKKFFKLSFIICLFVSNAYTHNDLYNTEDFSIQLDEYQNGNMLFTISQNNETYTIYTDLHFPDIVKKHLDIIQQILFFLKNPISVLSKKINNKEEIKHIKLKLRRDNSLKDFQNHVNTHYGRAKDGIKDFVIKV